MSVKFTDNSKIFLSAKDEAVYQALEAIGQAAEGHAKKLTPVDTGRLRNSIAYAVKDNAAYIGTNVEYAPPVEFGTSRGHKAHHMLKRAATEHGEEYKAIAKAAMKAAE